MSQFIRSWVGCCLDPCSPTEDRVLTCLVIYDSHEGELILDPVGDIQLLTAYNCAIGIDAQRSAGYGGTSGGWLDDVHVLV